MLLIYIAILHVIKFLFIYFLISIFWSWSWALIGVCSVAQLHFVFCCILYTNEGNKMHLLENNAVLSWVNR